MGTPPDFRLDHALLKRRFARAAAHCDEAAFLVREIARRMDERLDYMRIAPKCILDLGCGTGGDLARLAERYPDAERLGIDFAPPMLVRAGQRLAPSRPGLRRLWRKSAPPARLIAAEAAQLPLADASVSLIWSNLLLPAVDDPLPVFREMHRTLEDGGLLMFSTLGPDTLCELRAALPAHAGERVHRFIDMHDIGDALLRAGFSDPVMDMEMLTLTYARLDELFDDLRAAAANNAAAARARGLAGRADWARARAHYETLRRDARLPVSVEIIQGHAWKTDRPAPRRDDRAIIQFHPRPASAPAD
ncbi:MAG: methyltransferase domain-containing protein [Azoarcus sp.]|jgi:malonyl-CoA O-methyltransferase|nr:methyltransferase domain-containing protein [Azoarcus sp.]